MYGVAVKFTIRTRNTVNLKNRQMHEFMINKMFVEVVIEKVEV